MVKFGQLAVTYGSTYVLVALSIDRYKVIYLRLHFQKYESFNLLEPRYDAITHPMRFTRSYKRAKWLVLLAWMSSIAFSAPIIFFFSTKETEKFGTQCWLELAQPWQWQVYVVLVSLSIFILPALIIATCYTAITLTIWKRGRVMQPPVVTFAILPRGELQSVATMAGNIQLSPHYLGQMVVV